MKPKWSKKYLNEGVSIFSANQLAMFEFIKRKYVVDYSTFFDELSHMYDDKAPVRFDRDCTSLPAAGGNCAGKSVAPGSLREVEI